jgi:SAM-dependent methyltransferase
MGKLLPVGVRDRARRWLRPGAAAEDDDQHPERLAVLDHIVGPRVIEIGCGYRKTSSGFIGVDLVPKGARGRVGNVAGRVSQADIAADGGHLPFQDASVDSVVARHNLEHYVDFVGTLLEWLRVLRPGGRLVVVVPDEASYPGRTVDLDPTHYHSFDEAGLRSLFSVLEADLVEVRSCVPNWSLLAVATRASSD